MVTDRVTVEVSVRTTVVRTGTVPVDVRIPVAVMFWLALRLALALLFEFGVAGDDVLALATVLAMIKPLTQGMGWPFHG